MVSAKTHLERGKGAAVAAAARCQRRHNGQQAGQLGPGTGQGGSHGAAEQWVARVKGCCIHAGQGAMPGAGAGAHGGGGVALRALRGLALLCGAQAAVRAALRAAAAG